MRTARSESAAPKLGKVDSLVVMNVDVPANANGVLYALAGFSGGVTCYVKDGILSYEFNLFEIERTKIKAKEKLPTGKVKIEVESKLVGPIGGPMNVTLRVNGQTVAEGHVPRAMSCHFTSHPTQPSILAKIWIRQCRSTTTTRRRSPSMERSARRKSRI